MLRKRFAMRWTCLPAVLLVAGCVTTGGGQSDQLTNTVYETYRHVRKLDTDLGGAVSQLNQTATSLGTRVDETEGQVSQLRGSLEQNRQQLDALEQQVSSLTNALYRHFGLSVAPSRPRTAPPADVMVPGEVTIESQSAEQATAGPGPAGTPGTAPELDALPATPGGAAPAVTGESTPAEASPSTTTTVEAGTAEGATSSSAVAAYQEATRSFRDKDYAKAYRQFDDYIKAYPTTESAQHAEFWRAESCFRQGSQSADTGRIREAVKLYENYRQSQPTSRYVPYAIHNQAVAYVELQEKDEAIRLLRQLVQEFPADDQAVVSAKEKLAELEGRG